MIDCTEILLSTNMNKFVTDKNYFAFIYALNEIDYYFVLFCFYKLLARDFINTEANYHTDRSTVPYENLPLSGTRRRILSPCFIFFVLMSSSNPT